MVKLQSRIPEGPLAEKWSNYKSNQNLVNPANKRKLDVIVVGPAWPVQLQQPPWQKWDLK